MKRKRILLILSEQMLQDIDALKDNKQLNSEIFGDLSRQSVIRYAPDKFVKDMKNEK